MADADSPKPAAGTTETSADWRGGDKDGKGADPGEGGWAGSDADILLSAARGAERVLAQEEIDSLLGFRPQEEVATEQTGIRALINSGVVSYERLPMLEVVFDRLVRLATTSVRNFTSDNVDVALDGISSVRFADYIDSIPLPAMLGVFKAEEWDNFGLISVDSSLIYSIIDVLLGGGRSGPPARVMGRPHTTIENTLVSRLFEILLADAEQAFRPISPVTFRLERLETNPRFAAIARPANAAILVQLRVGMDDRGGKVEILLPYATIEPIRDLLLQMFMGEKFGRDAVWEGHLASEIHASEVDVDAVLFDGEMPLQKVLNLQVGQTLLFENTPQDPISVRCGDVALAEGLMGRRGNAISVRVMRAIKRGSPAARAAAQT